MNREELTKRELLRRTGACGLATALSRCRRRVRGRSRDKGLVHAMGCPRAPAGVYAALITDPAKTDPNEYDRECVIMRGRRFRQRRSVDATSRTGDTSRRVLNRAFETGTSTFRVDGEHSRGGKLLAGVVDDPQV